MNTLKIIAKVLCLYIPFFIFSILGINIFIATFADLENNTYATLTSYGAAIIAGLGSVTFNWSRSTEDKEIQKFAAKKGEKFLLTSIGFLLQAGIKYGYVEFNKHYRAKCIWLYKYDVFPNMIEAIIAVVFTITFTILINTLFEIAVKITSINKVN